MTKQLTVSLEQRRGWSPIEWSVIVLFVFSLLKSLEPVERSGRRKMKNELIFDVWGQRAVV